MENTARTFAITQHGSQMYGDKPYSYHLDRVAEIAKQFMPTYWDELEQTEALALAYLHDVGEDTQVGAEEIIALFGAKIEGLVDNISDEAGPTRKERKRKTWHKIRRDKKSVFIKLCDRLANVSEGGKLDMYRNEMSLFEAALYVPGEFEELWAAINEKLFA